MLCGSFLVWPHFCSGKTARPLPTMDLRVIFVFEMQTAPAKTKRTKRRRKDTLPGVIALVHRWYRTWYQKWTLTGQNSCQRSVRKVSGSCQKSARSGRPCCDRFTAPAAKSISAAENISAAEDISAVKDIFSKEDFPCLPSKPASASPKAAAERAGAAAASRLLACRQLSDGLPAVSDG